jgi:flagellar brake protein
MTAQTINVEELEKFTTSQRREILFYLLQLIHDGERVSVVFNEGKDTFLTLLLDIDTERNLLIFDWGGSEETNARLLKSERNFFVCAPHGIKNQFMTGTVRETSYNQRRAFVSRLPDNYTRLQRREFFRLVLPITRRPLCTLARPEEKSLQLPIIDISIGGIAMEMASAAPPFEIGQNLPGARIELKKEGSTIEVNLEVRNVGVVQRGNKTHGRIGCRFVEPSRAAEHLLQRFITDVQREERARLGT